MDWMWNVSKKEESRVISRCQAYLEDKVTSN